MAMFAAALAVFAVVPFGSVDDLPAWASRASQPRPGGRPGVDVGMVYIFAVGSIAVYGVVLGGWASNNKYSFLGGLRSRGPVDLLRNSRWGWASWASCSPPARCGWRRSSTSRPRPACGTSCSSRWASWSSSWPPLPRPSRLPFDLAEAEQELVGGYHTEYSGMKLMMYLVAEFLHMVTASFLIVILFLGGWHLWGLTGSAGSGHAGRWPCFACACCWARCWP